MYRFRNIINDLNAESFLFIFSVSNLTEENFIVFKRLFNIAFSFSGILGQRVPVVVQGGHLRHEGS